MPVLSFRLLPPLGAENQQRLQVAGAGGHAAKTPKAQPSLGPREVASGWAHVQAGLGQGWICSRAGSGALGFGHSAPVGPDQLVSMRL